MNLRISRIFLCLMALGLMKLVLLSGMGLHLWAEPVARGVVATLSAGGMADVVSPAEALAQQAPAQPAQTPASAGQNAAPAQPADAAQPAQAETLPPAGVDPLDWKALKERERELQAKERSLQALEKSLDQKIDELNKKNEQMQSMLDEAKGIKDQRLKHLVDVYSNMKAKQAAQVMETLDEELAVKILAGMRGRQAGEVLGFITPEKAAKLSEALTDLRPPFQQEGQ